MTMSCALAVWNEKWMLLSEVSAQHCGPIDRE